MASLASPAFTLTAPEPTPTPVPESARLLADARAFVAERGVVLLADWARVERDDANAWLIAHSDVGRAHGFVRATVRREVDECQT